MMVLLVGTRHDLLLMVRVNNRVSIAKKLLLQSLNRQPYRRFSVLLSPENGPFTNSMSKMRLSMAFYPRLSICTNPSVLLTLPNRATSVDFKSLYMASSRLPEPGFSASPLRPCDLVSSTSSQILLYLINSRTKTWLTNFYMLMTLSWQLQVLCFYANSSPPLAKNLPWQISSLELLYGHFCN